MKTTNRVLGISLLALIISVGIFSCKKKDTTTTEQVTLSQPETDVAVNVPAGGGSLSKSIKGTMQSDKVYYIDGDVTIKKGDTLMVNAGAKVYFRGNFGIIVRGSIVSLGTQQKPVWFTVEGKTKTDAIGAPILSDPAYAGSWGGIYGDTTTKMMIFKWTHIEFGCGPLATSPTYGMTGSNKPAYMISQVNPNGLLVLEDSWIYGGVDDPIRIQGGQIHIMRNTFEKSGGYTSGEGMNIKSGTVGNVAYNLIVGAATNGIKPSNNGGRGGITTIYAYNNTIIESGYRRSIAGRGGSINFEEGSRGKAYNNMFVNCRYGLRIIGYDASYSGNALKAADVANITYGNNFNYVDSLNLANQIYPYPFSTKPQSTDIPATAGWLPANYKECYDINDKACDIYDGTSVVGKNDPLFTNFPVKQNHSFGAVAAVGSFDFHLKASSPALNKGFTGFTPLNNVKVDPIYGATEVTLPGKDIGCYQSDGSGNKH